MAGPYEGWTEEPAAPAPAAAGPAPAPNAFAGWTEELPAQVEEERQDAQVLRTFEQTFGGNVERQAQVAKLAEETGLDAGLVDRQFDALQKSVGAGKFDARAWRKANPALADLVLRRPDLGPVAMQDQALPHVFGDDSARNFAGAAYEGVGGVIRGAGAILQTVGEKTTTPLANAILGTSHRTENILDPVAQWFEDYGRDLQEGVSAETKQALATSQAGGSLLDPKSITFGSEPSVSGYIQHGLRLFGGMLPIVAGGMASGGSALIPAALGGAQTAGSADEQARQIIGEMASTPTSAAPGAPSRLEAESPVYRGFLAQGMSRDEALLRTQDAAARWSVIATLPIGAAGGAFTGKNANPFAKAAREGIVRSVAHGAFEEASEEVLESVAGKLGIERGAGVDVDEFDGTFGDAVMGVIGGGLAGSTGALGDLSEAYAEKRTKRAQRLLEAAKDSPLAKASPQAFADWAKAEGQRRGEEVTAIHVDPEAVLKLNQDPMQAEQTARELFGEDGAEKLREALATGTKIEVPIALVPQMSAHPLAGKLLDHVAGSPGDFTANEKKTKAADLEQQTKEMVERFEAEDVPAESEAEARFLATLEQQLVATGVNDKKAAKHGVALWRAFARTQAARFGKSQDEIFERFAVAVERGGAESGAVRAAAQGGRLEQPAFHGTPHRGIEKFSLDKIGTGEGAQAFGWGLYFAQNKDVAEGYRKTLSGGIRINGMSYDDAPPGTGFVFRALTRMLRDGLDPAAALEGLHGQLLRDQREAKESLADSSLPERDRGDFEQILRKTEAGLDFVRGISPEQVERNQGQLHEVDAPEDAEILDWDAPLSEQPPAVLKALRVLAKGSRSLAEAMQSFEMGSSRGQTAYLALAKDLGSDKAASEALRDAGIPGLRYLDGTSRNDGDGTRNLVVWDESRVQTKGTFYQAQPSTSPRGFMERFGNSFRIVLNKNADLSTFLHETGHVFLEITGDLAERPDAPQQVKDDYAALLEWFGVTDRASIQREHHEKFARGFEAYLREGKAPSAKLAGAFERFKIWLTRIYKQASALNVQLSDEVRGVFDRMLATDAEIARAKARAGIPTKPQRVPGQSDADYARMVDAHDRAEKAVSKAATLRALELRQREQESWWKEELAKHKAEAAEEYEHLPATRAQRYVLRSEIEGVKLDPPVRLDRAEVEALIGKEAAKPLNHVLTKDKKKNPQRLQDVAAELGYASGPELLDTLLSHQTREQYADEVANRRMAQEHGDLVEMRRELAKKIEEVQHSEVGYEDVLLMEYVGLSATSNSDHPAVEAIRRSAQEIAQKRAIGKINPARVLEDERRASERYLAARTKNDLRAAVKAKREQLLNHFLYREMVKAEKARERFNDDVEALNNNKRRASVGLASPELRDMTDGLLIRLGLRAQDEVVPAFPGAGALAALLDGLGVPPVFDTQALTEIVFRRTDPKTITVEEMAVLHEALQQVKKAGTVAAEMAVAEKRRSYRELAELISEEASTRPDLGLSPKDEAFEAEERQSRLTGQGLISGYKQIELIFQDLGQTAHQVYRRFLEAQRVEKELGDTIGAKFTKHWDALPKAMQERRYETVDSSSLPVAGKTRRDETPTTREWMWMLFLNWGNDGNRQRLLDGYGWSEEQVVDLLQKNLTKEEGAFLQGVLDTTNALKPHTERIFERIHGIRPGSVRATPITLTLGGETVTYAGGYFPARYDSQSRDPSGVLGRKQEEAGIQDTRGSAAASVAKSFTKGRARQFVGVINLDWSVVPAHLSQVIHYVAYEEYVRDFNRLLKQDAFLETVERRLGKPYIARLEEWIKTVASGRDESVVGFTGELLGKLGPLRSRFMSSALAFNLKSVLADPLGVLNPWLSGSVSTRAMAATLANGGPRKYLRLRQEALAQSPELQKRAANLHDTLQHKAAEIGKRGNKSRKRKGIGKAITAAEKVHAPIKPIEDFIREHSFVLQEETDAYVSTLMWDAARRDYLRGAETRSEDGKISAEEEAKALQHADDVVRQHQPPATLLEQSAFLRDRKGVGALLAMFGYFSQLGNMGIRLVSNAETRADKARAFARWYAILLVSNVLGSLVTGGGPEDDETWAEWGIRKALSAPAMVIPWVGFVGEEIVNRLTAKVFHGEFKHRRFSFMTSPVLAAGERTLNALGSAAASDEPEEKVGALLEAYGIAQGLPVTQGKRTGVALWNMLTGETDPKDPLDAADKLLYGDSKYRGESPLSVGSELISGE